jgi:lipid II:glycine glycyltransferase (peptidoglycan interpeptide bridge formation enzyme)
MFSGSTTEGYRAGAQTYLYWRAVERFLEEGLVLLNRGGVPASAAVEGDPLHGLYRFKTRLGTTPVACYSGTKTLLPALAALRQWKGRRGAADGEERA